MRTVISTNELTLDILRPMVGIHSTKSPKDSLQRSCCLFLKEIFESEGQTLKELKGLPLISKSSFYDWLNDRAAMPMIRMSQTLEQVGYDMILILHLDSRFWAEEYFEIVSERDVLIRNLERELGPQLLFRSHPHKLNSNDRNLQARAFRLMYQISHEIGYSTLDLFSLPAFKFSRASYYEWASCRTVAPLGAVESMFSALNVNLAIMIKKRGYAPFGPH